MSVGTVIREYKFEKKLGEGSFGEVWKCTNTKVGKAVAIKIMEKNNDTAKQEIESFEKCVGLKCPFLCQYYDIFVDKDKLLIVMEFCAQGDLEVLYKSLSIKKGISLNAQRVMKIFIQMLLALKDLHGKNIVHRDLKPANTFVDSDDNVKLGDFGCCRQLTAGKKTVSSIGTPVYMAPEVFLEIPYDMRCDVWSLGVMVYEMITLELPFPVGSGILELVKNICSGKYKPIPKLSFPKEIIDIVYQMLTLDANKRPTVAELLKNPVVIESAKDNGLFKYFSGGTSSLPVSVPKPSPPPSPPASKTKCLVWRDSNLNNKDNTAVWDCCVNSFKGKGVNFYGVTTNAGAFQVLDKIGISSSVFVATNRGEDGAGFLKQCRARGIQTPMLVYCGYIQDWAPMPGVEISNAPKSLEKFITEKILK